LIAMAMMAMILTALATLTRQWLPNWNRGLTRVQRSEHLALALERIAADLAAAQFIPKMAGGRAPYFDGTEHAVTLVRTALNPNVGPALDIVRFHDSNSDNGIVVMRSALPFAPR